MKSIEQLIKEVPESRIRTSKWYYENQMDQIFETIDYNEFNMICKDSDGKLWNIECSGHNWENVHATGLTQWNDYYKPLPQEAFDYVERAKQLENDAKTRY